MKFGDKQSFAVELELDKDYGGAWLFGKICYWINGVQVGDYELGTSLRDVLSGMMWIVNDCGNRQGGALCGLSSQDVFYVLDEALYGSEASGTANDLETAETPARFEIKIRLDVFNGWKVFLIECGDRATILFKSADDEDVKVCALPSGAFDEIIKEVYNYLDDFHKRVAFSDTLSC